MVNESISVVKIRDVLMVTVPPDPDDETISALQAKVLQAMERYAVKGLILDISTVKILDSYFARTVVETSHMVDLMGGRTIVSGMQPSVAITAVQLGLTLERIETVLDVDQALTIMESEGE